MRFVKLLTLFLIINFAALGVGTWLMGTGAQGEWYLGLNKAPWTSEGWVFGAVWTVVMICYSLFMAQLWMLRPTFKVAAMFTAQFLLNIGWNHFFFGLHWTMTGLVILVFLLIIVVAFLVTYYKELRYKSLFITPYIIWLLIATSLNLYITIYN